jgi:hypothetical protein
MGTPYMPHSACACDHIQSPTCTTHSTTAKPACTTHEYMNEPMCMAPCILEFWEGLYSYADLKYNPCMHGLTHVCDLHHQQIWLRIAGLANTIINCTRLVAQDWKAWVDSVYQDLPTTNRLIISITGTVSRWWQPS